MKVDVKSTKTRRIIDFRKLGLQHLIVLGKYNYNRAQKGLENHVHENMIEICYCDKGRQSFTVNDEQFLVKGGEVFIHFPGEVHGSGGSPEEKGLLYWLIINISEKKRSNSDMLYLCNRIMEKRKRHFRASKQLKQILEHIFSAYSEITDVHLRNIRTNMLVHHFLLSVLDCIEQENKDTDSARLDKVLQFINKNISSDLPVSVLADEIYLSESRFKSFFKELSGFTPGDYIQRKRTEIGIKMLIDDPELSLSDIAYKLNFSSPQYFNTIIKKYTGTTPAAIRKNKR